MQTRPKLVCGHLVVSGRNHIVAKHGFANIRARLPDRLHELTKNIRHNKARTDCLAVEGMDAPHSDEAQSPTRKAGPDNESFVEAAWEAGKRNRS